MERILFSEKLQRQEKDNLVYSSEYGAEQSDIVFKIKIVV